MQEEEEIAETGPVKYNYKNYLLTLGYLGLLFWCIYEPTVRSIFFWFYLLVTSITVVVGINYLKSIEIKNIHIFNAATQFAVIILLIYGLAVPENGSTIAVILICSQLVQMVQIYYLKNLKTVRRTEERKGGMNRSKYSDSRDK